MKFLVCVDCQNDFMSQDGSLYNSATAAIRPALVNRVNKAIEDETEIVICTLDTHDKYSYKNTLEGKRIQIYHCINGSYGWSLIPELGKIADEEDFSFFIREMASESNFFKEKKNLIVPKTSFTADQLDAIISLVRDYCGESIDEIEICGVCTDICVISNALFLRSKFPNVRITVNRDLTAGTSDEATAAAIKVMESCLIDII